MYVSSIAKIACAPHHLAPEEYSNYFKARKSSGFVEGLNNKINIDLHSDFDSTHFA